MSLEANKAIVRRLYEDIVGRGRTELIDALVAEEVIDHNAIAYGWQGGREGVRTHAAFFGQVFRDFTITVDDLVAEGDRVIAFWSFRGVHQGEVWGVPATGREVTGQTVSIVKLRDGQVTEYESRPFRLDTLIGLGSLGAFAKHFAGEVA